MSCFQGRMNEYRNSALDRFDGKNLKCSAFFLSHCHTDHMVGLNASAFHDRLKSRAGLYLYCTEISRLLLLADDEYKHLERFIKVLDVGQPCLIPVPGWCGEDTKFYSQKAQDSYVTVTAISAGHCLGSVMFLFEGGEGTVLYTGDFRWEVDQASRISAFWNQGSVKTIQSVYVDTTFCVTEAFHIPSRNECVEAAHRLVADRLDKKLCDVVSISCPAKYGHEHFLLELAKRLNTKVHVPSWKVDVYNSIPDLKGYFTTDASTAILHSCATRSGFVKTYVLPCGYRRPPSSGERLRLLNIRPSTMWFTSTKTRCSVRDLVVAPASQRGLHRVCYSMHSSYSEIRDLVSFLRPHKVFPNVLPASDKDMTAVQKRLDSFIDHPNKFRAHSSSSTSNSNTLEDPSVWKPFGALRQRQRPTVTKYSRAESSESDDHLVFSSQEKSPCKSSLHHREELKSPAKEKSTTWSTKQEATSKSSPPVFQSQPSSSSTRRDVSIESHSSYSGSFPGHNDVDDDPEIDLFSDEDKNDDDDDGDVNRLLHDMEHDDDDDDDGGREILQEEKEEGVRVSETEAHQEDGSRGESLRSYVSGESDADDEHDEEEEEKEEEGGRPSTKDIISTNVPVVSGSNSGCDIQKDTSVGNLECDQQVSFSGSVVVEGEAKRIDVSRVQKNDSTVSCVEGALTGMLNPTESVGILKEEEEGVEATDSKSCLLKSVDDDSSRYDKGVQLQMDGKEELEGTISYDVNDATHFGCENNVAGTSNDDDYVEKKNSGAFCEKNVAGPIVTTTSKYDYCNEEKNSSSETIDKIVDHINNEDSSTESVGRTVARKIDSAKRHQPNTSKNEEVCNGNNSGKRHDLLIQDDEDREDEGEDDDIILNSQEIVTVVDDKSSNCFARGTGSSKKNDIIAPIKNEDEPSKKSGSCFVVSGTDGSRKNDIIGLVQKGDELSYSKKSESPKLASNNKTAGDNDFCRDKRTNKSYSSFADGDYDDNGGEDDDDDDDDDDCAIVGEEKSRRNAGSVVTCSEYNNSNDYTRIQKLPKVKDVYTKNSSQSFAGRGSIGSGSVNNTSSSQKPFISSVVSLQWFDKTNGSRPHSHTQPAVIDLEKEGYNSIPGHESDDDCVEIIDEEKEEEEDSKSTPSVQNSGGGCWLSKKGKRSLYQGVTFDSNPNFNSNSNRTGVSESSEVLEKRRRKEDVADLLSPGRKSSTMEIEKVKGKRRRIRGDQSGCGADGSRESVVDLTLEDST